MAFLKISGNDVSDYVNTLSISHEPVWNTTAGRALTGDYTGRIVTRKWKLQCTTKPLSQSEINYILGLLEAGDFFKATFIPMNSNGEMVTASFYVNAPSTTVYCYNSRLDGVRYKSLSFNIIEQ